MCTGPCKLPGHALPALRCTHLAALFASALPAMRPWTIKGLRPRIGLRTKTCASSKWDLATKRHKNHKKLSRLVKTSPRHLPVRELPPDFSSLLICRADHDAFLDHFDDVHRIHRIQKENLIRFACRKNPRSRGLHLGIALRIGTENTKRQAHVAGSPLGKGDARNL